VAATCTSPPATSSVAVDLDLLPASGICFYKLKHILYCCSHNRERERERPFEKEPTKICEFSSQITFQKLSKVNANLNMTNRGVPIESSIDLQMNINNKLL